MTRQPGRATPPRVEVLDLTDDAVATQVHSVGRRAYRVEADLIGSDAIPALHESLDQMRQRALAWVGALSPAGEVLAFVAWQVLDDGTLDVDRVCVDPPAFRRGLATTLLRHLLDTTPAARVTVSTGAANTPALALYERLGFRRTGTAEPVRGLLLSELELRRS